MRLFRVRSLPHTHALRVAAAAAAVVVIAGLGCSSNSSSSGIVTSPPAGVTADFTASTTAPAPDLVQLQKVGVSGDKVTVAVVITGPSTSTDIYAFAMDLVVADPTVASYVAGSLTVGDALTPGPNGLLSAANPSSGGSPISIGISKKNGDAGNSIPSGTHQIATVTFRILKTGSTTITVGPSGINTAVAKDSSLADIPSIVTDSGLATLTGK